MHTSCQLDKIFNGGEVFHIASLCNLYQSEWRYQWIKIVTELKIVTPTCILVSFGQCINVIIDAPFSSEGSFCVDIGHLHPETTQGGREGGYNTQHQAKLGLAATRRTCYLREYTTCKCTHEKVEWNAVTSVMVPAANPP